MRCPRCGQNTLRLSQDVDGNYCSCDNIWCGFGGRIYIEGPRFPMMG